MIVEILNPAAADLDAKDDGYLYSNLSDQDAWACHDFSYFEGKFTQLRLAVPTALLNGVRADCANNSFNRSVHYS
ncbi:hypothetical protein [Burkholderia anthina]|uniref:hypothetical protein n=1 Tax=Burkholderia anthina TaxID=179879 RepID=UPI001588F224|nr:hypothetical protein [Burkholderia anthina]